jgi:amino acid transporter
MEQTSAAILLLLWIVVPSLHIIFSPDAGNWMPPKNSKCPFGPRAGWLIIVIMLGLIGWLMFLRSRKAR